MRLPRWRFTVRRLMVSVAVAAVLAAAVRGWGLSRYYQRKALLYAKAEACCGSLIRRIGSVQRGEWPGAISACYIATLPDGSPLSISGGSIRVNHQEVRRGDGEMIAKLTAMIRREGAYYARLKQKYEIAAWNPWIPVDPGPPEPE